MNESISWEHHFEPYSRTHLWVVVGLFVLVTTMVLLRRRPDVAGIAPVRRRMDRFIGWAGLAGAVFVQTVTLWPSRFNYLSSLPLHICDIMMFVAPAALLLDWRGLRALSYFWGIGLSSISFIYPDLHFGPKDFQFWVFWTGHVAVVLPALYDITARGFRPRWRDWVFAAVISTVYICIFFPLDAYFHLNYGYIGQTYKHQTSPMDHLGPWPWRVPLIYVLVLAVMLLLLLPWSIVRKLKAENKNSSLRSSAGVASNTGR